MLSEHDYILQEEIYNSHSSLPMNRWKDPLVISNVSAMPALLFTHSFFTNFCSQIKEDGTAKT